MSTGTIRPDTRTEARRRADEAIADYFESFIVRDPATGWAIHAATDERRKLAEAAVFAPDNAIAVGGLNAPFLWNGSVYRVTRASHRGGETAVEVSPPDPAFEAEVRRRIDATPYHVLTFYQGFGFVCFPEDYAKYQG